MAAVSGVSSGRMLWAALPAKRARASSVWKATRASQADSLHLADFRRAFDRLSEAHREVLVLIGLEGMDYQRAASILGVEIGTVKSRVFRARECLRREQLMLERPTPRSSWRAAA